VKIFNEYIVTFSCLRSALKQFFGRYHHLTLPYRVLVTTMANDICMPWYCCHEYVSFVDTR